MENPVRFKKGVEKNIRKLFEKVPSLKKVLTVLNENKIKYGIFAGTHVSLLTSNREPTDVDVLIADDDFEKLSSLFKGYSKRIKEVDASGDFFYMNKGNKLEFVSRLDFIDKGNVYPIRLTPLAWKYTNKFFVDGIKVVLLNPVDTLLEKAILPRGKEVGKHDLEDISALVETVEIDKGYLEKRVNEMRAKRKVEDLLKKFNLI